MPNLLPKHQKRYGIWTTAFLAILGALQSCATVEPPSGGPPDKYPPRVIAVSPAPRTINSAKELDIQIQFNEWIMNPVPRTAIRISPPLDGKLETEVDGDLLVIRSKAPLDTLTTYTITVGSILEDLHSNPVAKPFQLVFSTGPQIDTLRLRGQISIPDSLLRQKKLPTIGLFPIGANSREQRRYLMKLRDSTFKGVDSLPRLHLESALYIGQADSLGWFQIDGIAPGRYRAMAFYDLDGNNHIDPATEIGGLADRDILIDSTHRDTLFWSIGNLDTAHAQLMSVNPISPLAAKLEFSRALKLDSTFQTRCVLRKTDSSQYGKIKALWLSTDPRHLILAFDSVKVDSTYLIGCDSANWIRTTWILPKDSLKLQLLQFKLLGPAPATDSIPTLQLTYNIPVLADTLSNNLRILSGKDTLELATHQIDPVRIGVKPKKGLPMGISFKLAQFVKDTIERKVKLQTLGSFETMSSIKLAKLQGRIRRGDNNTRVRLKAPGKTYTWTALCNPKGEFKIERIPEGPYLLDAFHDLDLDSLPSPGSLFPYKPGEAWRSVPDTIRVGADLLPTTLDSILFSYPLPQRTH